MKIPIVCGPTGRPVKEVIKRNSAVCLKCGDEVVSRHRHDFVSCSCDGLFVDGGLAYLRRGSRDGAFFKDTSIVEVVEMTNSEIADYKYWGFFEEDSTPSDPGGITP